MGRGKNVLYADAVRGRGKAKAIAFLDYRELPSWIVSWHQFLKQHLQSGASFEHLDIALEKVPANLDMAKLRRGILSTRLRGVQKALDGVSSPGSWLDGTRPALSEIQRLFAEPSPSSQQLQVLEQQLQETRTHLEGILEKTGNPLIKMVLAGLQGVSGELSGKENIFSPLEDLAEAMGEWRENLSKGFKEEVAIATYAADAKTFVAVLTELQQKL